MQKLLSKFDALRVARSRRLEHKDPDDAEYATVFRMNEYSEELTSAVAQGGEAFAAINSWLDRPNQSGEQIPTVELERRIKALRASRARLLALKQQHGDAADIADALLRNAEYYRAIGVSLPPEE